MNKQTICIQQAHLVLPHQVAHGNLWIQDGMIQKIDVDPIFEPNTYDTENVSFINASGMYLLPGFIDIHCDAIEKEVEPRPNTLFPLDMAFLELEKKLAAAGITTMYHSLSLGVGLSLRGIDITTELLDWIHRYKRERTMIKHRIHLRYEITCFEGLPLVRKLIQEGKVDYLSYMNHAPGIGQYHKPGSFEAYVMKNQGVTVEEVQEIAERVIRLQDEIDWDALRELARFASRNGIQLASHDDDTREQVNKVKTMGVSISEFPINLDTAKYARQQSLSVCVGAPNIVRGGSHDKNLNALEAIKADAANIICSDYSPASIIHSVFTLVHEGIPLSHAVNLASLHPAKAMGIAERTGSIEEGKQADLILVDMRQDRPTVRKTFVNGVVVYQSDFIDQEPNSSTSV